MAGERRRQIVRSVLVLVLAIQVLVMLLVDADLTFAIILGFVAVKLASDRAWLVVPIIINGLAFLDVVARTVTKPAGLGPPLLEPFLTYGLFFVAYGIGYGMLGDPSASRGQASPAERASRSAGWGFDRWAG